MDSDLQPHQFSHHFHLPKPQMNTSAAAGVNGGGSLTRYRSAPSSYFNSFMDAVDTTATDFSQHPPQQPRPLSPETESILARFMQNDGGEGGAAAGRPGKLYDIPENSPVLGQQAQFMGAVKQEAGQIQSLAPPSSSSQMNYQSNSADRSFSSMDFPPPQQMKMGSGGGGRGRGSSSLVRHRSSPAGLFDDIVIENGFLVDRETGAGNFGSGGRSGINSQINFSSGETQMVPGNSDNGVGGRRFANRGDDGFMNNFGSSSWDDETIFSGQEMGCGGDFNSPENQNREGKNRPPGLLAHHLSLPKESMEKLLQFQDAVPCKIRAKRGCATHPRSIAERVRRTKISERMRKLQDLVPNMDKQTNTSDMLDLAVDYIKDLRKQVKSLTDNRANCTCTS